MKRVTEVLGTYFDKDKIPADVLENACRRGSGVHRTCLAHALGLPSLYDPQPDEVNYISAFDVWFARNVKGVIMAEQRLFDCEMGLSGSPDLVVVLITGEMVLIDLKTPSLEQRTWKCQIAAYLHLARKKYPMIAKGGTLRLPKEGEQCRMSWLSPYEEKMAWNAFRGKLIADNYILGGK